MHRVNQAGTADNLVGRARAGWSGLQRDCSGTGAAPAANERKRETTTQKKGPKPLLSEKSALREAKGIGARNDEVVEHPHIDECERLLESLGQKLVGTARFGDAGWMVVREDHRSRVLRECDLHDLAWVDACLGQRATEELDVLDKAILRVEHQCREYLVRKLG